MASTLRAMAFNLLAMASKSKCMKSNLVGLLLYVLTSSDPCDEASLSALLAPEVGLRMAHLDSCRELGLEGLSQIKALCRATCLCHRAWA